MSSDIVQSILRLTTVISNPSSKSCQSLLSRLLSSEDFIEKSKKKKEKKKLHPNCIVDEVAFTVKANDADASPNGDVYFTTLEGPSFPGRDDQLFGIQEVTG